jgi:two-component sensor histidine kinase
MENLIRLLPARPQPFLVRLGATTAMVLVSFLLRMGIEERAGPYGFVLFIPAIVAASIVFDRGSGFFAAALTIVLVSLLLHWPDRVQAHLASVASFGVVSAGLVLVSEGMRKALERAVRAEAEKDLLLRELSHRFRNNFAVAASVLALQARTLSEPTARAALEAGASRIRVIAEAQAHLHPTSRKGDIEIDTYLEDLCRSLGDALRDVRPVAVRVLAEPITLPADRAVPIGLIVNELVTNAFKYAFPAAREGTVTVRIEQRSSTELSLEVSDNGIGCPDEVKEGLGSNLVRLLVQQLGGTLRREQSNPGCRVTIVLPLT